VCSQQVLVVDDDAEVRQLLRDVLEEQGYAVQAAACGEEALEQAVLAPPDVVILDLMLPDMSGLEICKALRDWSQVPIIALSAKTQARTKAETLDQGADAYITKPFKLEELLAQVRAALRRAPDKAPSPVLEQGELRLDLAHRRVTLGGREVRLTPTEYAILQYLMAHAGKVVTHGTLLEAVWGPGYAGDQALLRVFVAQLRRKIEPSAAAAHYILTVPRIGYRFRSEEP
jgi:two-component system, OmpR family, KDP operon response regulator KdpE